MGYLDDGLLKQATSSVEIGDRVEGANIVIGGVQYIAGDLVISPTGVRPHDRMRPVAPNPRQEPAPDTVLTHREFVAGLGPMKNLTPDRLAFVTPGAEHPSHPDRLLAALRKRTNDRGILLVGPAGVGKSRTCLEVAELAEASGMRALHVQGGEPAATVEHIHDAVLADPSPALVVIDYLSDCHGLRLADLGTRLFQKARGQGVEVALLATARSGWMTLDESEPVHSEFEIVRLRVDTEHQEAVRAAILDAEARTALRIYGREKVERACGRRPVIAMLIAREFEVRAKDKAQGLDSDDLDDLVNTHRADLVAWLLSRLGEDRLVVRRPRDPFELVEPHPRILGAAAVVAACPQPREAVERVTAQVFGNSPKAQEIAQRYVDCLVHMEWVEQEGANLVVVHHIVVDKLLEQVLLSAPGNRVRHELATTLLAPAIHDARTAGRLALHLVRLIRDLRAEGRADELAEFCAGWLRDNAVAIGTTFLEDANASGFTLGTLLAGPPWADAAIEQWSDLIGPWLTQYGRTPQARHLYFKGLYLAPADRAANLADGAIEWLETHGERAGAGFVLSALLNWDELGEQANIVTRRGLDWVRRHSGRTDAQFVLSALLTRGALGRDSAVAVEYARRWLRLHHDRDDARFVLGALMAVDLGLATKEILALTLEWLQTHQGYGSATVLSGMLGRGGDTAVPVALCWLKSHGSRPAAQYVLEPLVKSHGLDACRAELVVRRCLIWLIDNRDRYGGGFLLRSLLDRPDLGEHAATTVDLAMTWLERHREEQVAGAVLSRLMRRDDLGTWRAATLATAVTWLARHHPWYRASEVVQVALAQPDLGIHASDIVAHGVGWLIENRKDELARSIMVGLLSRDELGAHTDTVTAHAHWWLITHQTNDHADVVRAALATGASSDLDAALTWLDEHPNVAAADVLLKYLLGQADAEVVERHGLAWLERHHLDPDAQPILCVLLRRPDLGGAVIGHALAWVAHNRVLGRGEILKLVLSHADLGERAGQGIALAVDWLDEDEDASREPHHMVLKPLLELENFSEQVLNRVVRWLDTHDAVVGQILPLVLRVNDELGAPSGALFDHSLAWVRANPGHVNAGHVLSRLLARADLGEWSVPAVDYGCVWLDASNYNPETLFVVGRLLERDDLGDRTAEVIAHGLRWLGKNPVYPKAWFVLTPLLVATGLGRHSVQAAAHARDWLAATDNDPDRRADVEAALATLCPGDAELAGGLF